MKMLSTFLVLLCTTLVYSQSSERLVISNANYLDIEKGFFVSGDLLIEDGLIKHIGIENIEDTDARTIDASGKYIIPGLIDAHIHLFQSGAIYTRPDAIDLTAYKSYDEERKFLRENASDLLRRYLRCGITTVVDIGGPMYQFEFRKLVENNSEYPNLLMTGPLITTFDVPAWEMKESPIIRARSEKEARQLVRDQLPFNPDFIKIWGVPLPTKESTENYEITMAAIDEAKKNNLRVFAHATSLNSAKMAIKAGADVLVHSVSGWSDIEFSEMLRDSNVVLIPTLIVSKNYSRTFAQDFQPSKEDFEISNPFILGEIFDTEHLVEEKKWSQTIEFYPRIKESFARIDSNNMLNFDIMKRYSNTIATGTDAGNIGTLHAS